MQHGVPVATRCLPCQPDQLTFAEHTRAVASAPLATTPIAFCCYSSTGI
jgi:hypothetical protein